MLCSRWIAIEAFCLILAAAASGLAQTHPAARPQEAFYVASTSVEHQIPPVSAIRLTLAAQEPSQAGPLVWWEMAARLRDGGSFGVRILSERAPMTSPAGIGRVEHYIYRDATSQVLEYRDAATGKALLPVIQFEHSFLPRPSSDALFEEGFASSGALLGHVLTRVPSHRDLPRLSFDSPALLSLRTDLLIGMQVCLRSEQVKTKDGTDAKHRPWTREDYVRMIAAGANYFGPDAEHLAWIQAQPVLYRGRPAFPDSFYRSNYVPGHMFIDEPMVRMGWSGDIPANAGGPEQVAEALRQRVASHYALEHRLLKLGNGAESGTLDVVLPPPPSWDTEYWSAWYQMAAGAPAVIHEGRYVKRGYGWEPDELYGTEGLDGLAFRDQVNCMDAILRGAARAFNAHWGVSVYPEGEPALRLPALTQAYDMGARHLWFWTYPPLTYEIEEELIRGISKHVAEHPRGDLAAANRAAKVGISFPPGHAFSWGGTWGVQREQRSPGGASYGDISAAGMWEGIICSRRGMSFDFLVDDPRIRSLGYERLVIVRNDGRLEVTPPWPEPRAPRKLTLAFDDGPIPNIAARAGNPADYTVRRANAIGVDGHLDDWKDANWISLTAERDGFPDPTWLEIPIINDLSRKEWQMHFVTYMGMTFKQIDEALEKKYVLEGLNGRGVVVTGLEPGSPAAKAGILEGDVIRKAGEWTIDWQFQMHEHLSTYNAPKHDGRKILLRVRRSGRYRFGASGDLAAQVALAVDDHNLYVAAKVTDDTHCQPQYRGDFWKADCLQLAFDPALDRRDRGFGEEDHEIGLVLQDGRPFAWRWHGRRGRPIGEMPGIPLKILREANTTIYEAAVPLAELAPMAPDLWPAASFNLVINDSDGTFQRKGRLELRPKSMTMTKRTRDFARLVFEPSPDRAKVSAAMLWRRRATAEKGAFRAVVASRSAGARSAQIVAQLRSLDSPETPAVAAELALPLIETATERSLAIWTDSPPGRYDLRLEIRTDGGTVAEDHLPVYVYPQ